MGGFASAASTTLRYLDFSNTRMNDEGLLEVASALPQLTSVMALSFNHNPAISDTAISGLVQTLNALNGGSVRYLDLIGIGIGNEGASAVASLLADDRPLMLLNLRNNAIAVEGVAKVAEAAVA